MMLNRMSRLGVVRGWGGGLVGLCLLAALGAVGLVSVAGTAGAQQGSGGGSGSVGGTGGGGSGVAVGATGPGASLLALRKVPPVGFEPVLIRSATEYREWTVRFAVDITASNAFGGLAIDGRRISTRTPFLELDSAAFVFPMIGDTGWSLSRPALFRGKAWAEGSRSVEGFRTVAGVQGPSEIAVWEMGRIRSRDARLEVDIPMRSHVIGIDEDRAVRQYPWPTRGYPAEVAVNLQPQLFVDSGNAVVQKLVSHWLDGRAPRSAPAYLLAKFLAARVLEHVQPNGLGVYVGGLDGGNVGTFIPSFAGFESIGASVAGFNGAGTPNDLANLLCAAYRAAGLPARLTIVVDTDAKEAFGVVPPVRPLVEFYLYNEVADFGEWIPVDIIRQREFSSQAPPLNQRWEYFGGLEDADELAPITHHWHPPAGVTNVGPAALWGWVPSPGIPFARQLLRFDVLETPRVAADGPNDGYVALRDLEGGRD